jgi:hypothetical protein
VRKRAFIVQLTIVNIVVKALIQQYKRNIRRYSRMLPLVIFRSFALFSHLALVFACCEWIAQKACAIYRGANESCTTLGLKKDNLSYKVYRTW